MKLRSLVGGSADVIGPEASIAEAALAIVQSEGSCLAVIDGRSIVGVITERDIVSAVADEDCILEEDTVADWMSQAPDVFAPDVSVREAASWLLEAGYRHLPVVENGELLGVVEIRDVLWALASDHIDAAPTP